MKGTCAPKKINEFAHTCYSSEALIKMRNSWNTRNKDSVIKHTDPTKIWLEFKKIFKNTCNIESCWIEQEAIKSGLERDIINYTFSPKKQSSWEKKPRTWLDSNDIKEVMRQYEKEYENFNFIGPSPIDFDSPDSYTGGKCVWPELCNFDLLKHIEKNINVVGIIFNLDKHTQSGSHWNCILLDLRKGHLYYFDSFGKQIHKNINRMCEKIIKECEKCNQPIEFFKLKNVHQEENTECGMYSLYFISSILTNKHDYHYFEHNKINDDEMFKYRSIFFS